MDKQTIFYHLLGNTLFAAVINMFIWFSIAFWVFLETESVLATSYVAGIFAVANMLSAFVFGNIVDHNRKKKVMIYSSVVSLVFYIIGAAIFFTSPPEVFNNANSITLWGLIIVLMFGSVAGNLRLIALSTTVTMLFSEGKDKANCLVGAMNGVSFSLTSVLSGLVIGFFGMGSAIVIAIIVTILVLAHLPFVPLIEKEVVHMEGAGNKFNIKKTIAIIVTIPGLMMLIFFTTLNNFLGGVFMALMDAYGLSLVSVQTWGVMFSLASLGFIVGSVVITKVGLGKNPLRALLIVNMIVWIVAALFTIQPSVWLLFVGLVIWMAVSPFAEAAEQTIIQSVVPFEKQGRVFGFAQSVESAATPITAFLIGPIATFIFIPFMTTGAGVDSIGDWFGVGQERGIALVFVVTGLIGIGVTLLAFKTNAYRILSKHMESVKI